MKVAKWGGGERRSMDHAIYFPFNFPGRGGGGIPKDLLPKFTVGEWYVITKTRTSEETIELFWHVTSAIRAASLYSRYFHTHFFYDENRKEVEEKKGKDVDRL